MKWTPDPRDPHRYDDMLDLPHPVSALHPPMSRLDRAAQFAPFAALTGLGAAINETARQTEERSELGAEALAELDGVLRELREKIRLRPLITAVVFRPDPAKSGGAYVTVSGAVRWLDEQERLILLADGTRLPWADLRSLQIVDNNRSM